MAVYSIHDIVRVRITDPRLAAGYDDYLRYFRVADNAPGDPDYEVLPFSEFKLPRQYLSGGGFTGFPEGVAVKKERYAVESDGKRVREYTTYANRATNMWLQNLFVPRGHSLVHSAGIALRGKGIIFPAFGGAGKTIFIAKARALPEFSFFGDDYVIVGKDGVMRSYPSDFSIYDYHLHVLPELRDTYVSTYLRRRKWLGPYYFAKRAANFLAKRVIRSGKPLFDGPVAAYAKVPAATLLPREVIGAAAPLHASVFLTRADVAEFTVRDMSLEQLTSRILSILDLEFRYGLPYRYALGGFGGFDVATFTEETKAILAAAMKPLKKYEILIPLNMDMDRYTERLIAFVESIV